jgi:hypothetical protein
MSEPVLASPKHIDINLKYFVKRIKMFFKGMVAILITVYLPGVGHFLLGQFKKGFMIIGVLLAEALLFSSTIVANKELFAKLQQFVAGGIKFGEAAKPLRDMVEASIGAKALFMWQFFYAIVLAYALTDIIMMMKRNYDAQRLQK